MAARTLLLKFAETDALWSSWRWIDRPGEVEASRLPAEVVERLTEILDASLPEPSDRDGVAETGDDALRRALTEGWLSSPAKTRELGGALGDALLPAELVNGLRAVAERSGANRAAASKTAPRTSRPRLRIQLSPLTARVPWALVRIGLQREPLLDLADVEFAPPAPIRARAAAPVAGDSVVAVVDPRVPGARADSALGSVLGRPTENDALAALLRHGDRLRPRAATYAELVRRRDIDRDWLRHETAFAARLLYVGHATGGAAADAGAGSALHLAGSGPHVPITAAELVRDHWRMPARCALVACGSGSDLRDPEPFGLSLAAMMCGALVVTATAWRLPTDEALRVFAGEDLQAFRELVLAVDAAHEATDPVAALCAWQRERLCAWDAHGSVADAPLVWASLLTFTRDAAL